MQLPERSRLKGPKTIYARQVANAKAICATCPVKVECREWAMSKDDPAIGFVAGGLTPDDRDLRRATAARRAS